MADLSAFDGLDPALYFKKLYELANGERPEYSDSDKEKYSTIRTNYEQLKNPVQVGNFQSSFNPSNPFSFDTRGILSGVQSLTQAFLEKERRKRLYGDKKKQDQFTSEADKIAQERGMVQNMNSNPYANANGYVPDPNSASKMQELAKQEEDLRAKAKDSRGIAAQLLDAEQQKKDFEEYDKDYKRLAVPSMMRLQEKYDDVVRRKAEKEEDFEFRRTENKFNQDQLNERQKKALAAAKEKNKADEKRLAYSAMRDLANASSGYKDLQDVHQKDRQHYYNLRRNQFANPEDVAAAKAVMEASGSALTSSRKDFEKSMIALMKENGYKIPTEIENAAGNLTQAQKEDVLKQIYPTWESFEAGQKTELLKAWDEGRLDSLLNNRTTEPNAVDTDTDTEQIDLTGEW